MFDMMKMMGKLKEAQERIKETQEKLADMTVVGEAGAGMVKATANGQKRLVSLEIDNDLIKPEDKDMLRDLIIAATNKALEEADNMAKEELRKSTDGLIPNIPGMNLGGLF
ncbi:YbaB/EbfC family nucleoid-associated protein [Fulvivirgaceae bacterium BMA10]|uniref:Nucleoid-associated protein QQ008_08320 n=1 Tax=Splendidivirga corallicola TaxID=3051826 RepID=A0ABT8KNS0_9BACT|nr:YbaB/EbfC family nucleoid-associated protein [Fulvivirgaceae bacterium BMA10]